MDRLRLIEVPLNSIDHFINNVGCLRYTVRNGVMLISSVVKPVQIGFYLQKDLHEIVGYFDFNDKKYIAIKNK